MLVRRASDDALQAEYKYDALGRRINKKSYIAPVTDGDGVFYLSFLKMSSRRKLTCGSVG